VKRTRARTRVFKRTAPFSKNWEVMQHSACSRSAVLIVEDEVLLRWTAVTIVEEAGFDVVRPAR